MNSLTDRLRGTKQQARMSDDKWTNWTCIPGRICGGSQFMRDAETEIERLRKIEAALDYKDAEIERLREIINTRLPDQGRQIKAMRPIIDAAREVCKVYNDRYHSPLINALAQYEEQNDG